jgi:hypothetical protein
MVHRIAVAQQTERMLGCVLLKEGDGAMYHFEKRQACQSAALTLADDPTAPYLPWDQSISQGEGAIASTLREASDKALRFLVAAIATNAAALATPPSSSSAAAASTTSASGAKPAGFTTAADATNSAVEAVTALHALQQALPQMSPFLLASSEHVLSPAWIRTVVAFVRTVAMELTLVIQVALTVHGKAPSEYKYQGGTSGLAQYQQHVQGLKCPPLGGAQLLQGSVEVVAEIFLSTLGKFSAVCLQSTA